MIAPQLDAEVVVELFKQNENQAARVDTTIKMTLHTQY